MRTNLAIKVKLNICAAGLIGKAFPETSRYGTQQRDILLSRGGVSAIQNRKILDCKSYSVSYPGELLHMMTEYVYCCHVIVLGVIIAVNRNHYIEKGYACLCVRILFSSFKTGGLEKRSGLVQNINEFRFLPGS